MQTTKQKGDLGELLAIKYLQKNEYQIKDVNYKF
jgi:Holliday junction resolvase-like predicted endonuclease